MLIKKYLIKIITIIMWLCFCCSLIWINKQLIIKSLIIAVVFFIVMIFWKKYNIKKFGNLNRRKFPEDTTIEDIVQFFGVDEEKIIELQNSKIIVIEENLF